MKTKLIVCLSLILSAGLIGCSSVAQPRVKVNSAAGPFITALKAYHRDTGDYPKQLDDLRPHYLAKDTPWEDHRDPKQTWVLLYERIDRDNYKLYLDSSPCSQAIFENGTFITGVGPNYQ